MLKSCKKVLRAIAEGKSASTPPQASTPGALTIYEPEPAEGAMSRLRMALLAVVFAAAGTWLIHAARPFDDHSGDRAARISKAQSTNIAKAGARPAEDRFRFASQRAWLLAAAAEIPSSPIVTGAVAAPVHQFTVRDLPDGARLSRGERRADASWVVAASDLEELVITVPARAAHQPGATIDLGEHTVGLRRLAIRFETERLPLEAIPAPDAALPTAATIPEPIPAAAAAVSHSVPGLPAGSAVGAPLPNEAPARAGSSSELIETAPEALAPVEPKLPSVRVQDRSRTAARPNLTQPQTGTGQKRQKARANPQANAKVGGPKPFKPGGSAKPSTAATAKAPPVVKSAAMPTSSDPRMLMLQGLGAGSQSLGGTTSP